MSSTEGNPTSAELARLIASIREAYGISIREYAMIVGIPKNSMSNYAYTKKGTVTPETFGNMIAPFSFGFSPELLPERRSQRDGGLAAWGSADDGPPEGYVEFIPIRDDMLRFKEEENSSWRLLADYFGYERKQFTQLFVGVDTKGKKYMTDEIASRITKGLRQARSLTPQRRREIFAKGQRNPERFYDYRVPRDLIDSYLSDYGVNMKVMSEEIGIGHSVLRHLRTGTYKRCRVSTVENLRDAIREARLKREKRINHTIGSIEMKYFGQKAGAA